MATTSSSISSFFSSYLKASFSLLLLTLPIYLSLSTILEPIQLLVLISFLGITYYLYQCKYSQYLYEFIPAKPAAFYRGKPPPSFPNGWYVIARSSELQPGSVKAIKESGQDIVLFRGENKEIFALEAFCPHSGANMGVGGLVKFTTCIQCPFHGWLFDGNTGNLVVGEKLIPRKVSHFEYNPDLGTCKLNPEETIRATTSGYLTIRKYLLRELNGFIYIWLHADKNALPTYEPFDFSDIEARMLHKGTSRNKVYCHCQDIVENGGDIRHFIYIHSTLLHFTSLVKAQWDAIWLRGDDPKLREKMTHSQPWINEYKQRLFDKYLTPENSSSIGVMSLDMSFTLFNISPVFFFNATIFQVGPGIVYLFLISPFYEVMYFQHTSSSGKFDHDVYHELYSSWYIPHWITALFLRIEAHQVTNDTSIWNNKVFARDPKYNLDAESDVTILSWRKWFGQFYEGCADAEALKDKLIW